MTILKMSIIGAVLTGLITLLRKTAGRRLLPGCYLVLWAVAGVRFLLPLEIPSPFSVYNIVAEMHRSTAEIQYVAVPEAVSDVVTWVNIGIPYENGASVNWLFVLWALGAVFCFMYMAGSHWQCRRWYAASLPLEESFVKQWKVAHPLRRIYQIRCSERIQTPLTYGLFRPVILLPSAQKFCEDELHLVLLHEWNHIRHLDILWQWLLVIICSIHWFNPMAWVMYVLCRQDMELFCDAASVKQMNPGENRSYAMLLLEQAARIKRPATMFSLSRFTGYQRMEERIETIMKPKTFNRKMAAAMAILLCIGGIAFATNAQNEADNEVLHIAGSVVEELAWPIDTDAGVWISTPFGESIHPVTGEILLNDYMIINGQDREGEPILAAADGVVKASGFHAKEGYYLLIDHGSGVETRYGHCASLLVKEDDTVKAGQEIASLGKTGKVTGPCLSFAVYKNGVSVDPLPLLESAEKQ